MPLIIAFTFLTFLFFSYSSEEEIIRKTEEKNSSTLLKGISNYVYVTHTQDNCRVVSWEWTSSPRVFSGENQLSILGKATCALNDITLYSGTHKLGVIFTTYSDEECIFTAKWRGAPHYNSSGPLSFTYITTKK